MFREVKPKNPRSARAVAKKAPQLIENPKKTLFLRSTTSSSLVNSVVKDLYSLKRPLGLRFTKKNPIHPFEDASSLEFFSQKNDTSLLCFSSHSKKRPHCITFVRCFDAKVLDMLECTVLPDTARLIQQFGGPTARVGIKPMLSFSGPQFEDPTSETGRANKFALAKSLFIDFFRGETAKDIDVEGLELMISFAASEDGLESGKKREVVHMRVWRVITKRSNQRLPRVELEEMGPSLDFVLGRVKEPDNAMLKESLKRAKSIEAKSKKNVETDVVGDKIGRIHLGRQDLDSLQTRKMKGLKRERDRLDELDEAAAKADEISGSSSDDLLIEEADMMDVIDDDDEEEEEEEEASEVVAVPQSKRQRTDL